MTRGLPLGEGIRPPRRICATPAGRQPQDRRRHIGLTDTEAPARITEGQPQGRRMSAGLVSTSRTDQSLTILTSRDMMFRPLRLTEDIGNEQRGFLSFSSKNF